MSLKNKVQLITYADSLGKNLQELHFLLNRHLKKAIGGVHILPFYPSTADRGFCPTEYDTVDPKFGTWEDVEKIAKDYDLMADFIPNHISRQSKYFQDYLSKGKQSKYYDMFLQISKLWPDGRIPEEELKNIYLRKPSAPEFLIEFPDGSKEYIWQTFESDQQIDLDIKSKTYRDVYGGFFLYMLRRGVKLVRLDALAYVTKKVGTDCFFVEPDIWEYLDWIKKYSQAFGAELLPEIHGNYKYQQKFVEHGLMVYDFVLPLMTAHAVFEGNSQNLKNWFRICPRKQVTTLDTHDGVPVVDCEGFMKAEEIERTWQTMVNQNGGQINYNYNGDGSKEVYQIDGSYFSLLGEHEDRYVMARAIQLLAPGIPQVYYNGLLAGKHDHEAMSKFTGQKVGAWGRELNRHNYSIDEAEEFFAKPIVKRIVKLMEFRSNAPAFDGSLEINDSESYILDLSWRMGEYYAKANLDLKTYKIQIEYNDGHKNVHTFQG
jgi:sucrose phosphorylase